MHWVIEARMDKEFSSADVTAKREAARRWGNHVNADEKVVAKWHYLIVWGADIKDSEDSWTAIRKPGT